MVDSAAANSGCPLSPHGTMLCTDKTPVRERFGLWREGARHLLGVVADAPQDWNFSGRAFIRTSGPFRFVTSESTGFRAAWGRTDAPHADYYSILLQLGGQTIATRGEEAVALGAGEFGYQRPRYAE